MCRADLILNLGSRMVACRNLKALPHGGAHRLAYGKGNLAARALVQRVSGQLEHPRERRTDVAGSPAARRIRTAFPGPRAPDRSPRASTGFYAARPPRQSRRMPATMQRPASVAHDARAAARWRC